MPWGLKEGKSSGRFPWLEEPGSTALSFNLTLCYANRNINEITVNIFSGRMIGGGNELMYTFCIGIRPRTRGTVAMWLTNTKSGKCSVGNTFLFATECKIESYHSLAGKN